MKKFVACLFILSVSVFAVGCGKTEDKTVTKTTTTTTTGQDKTDGKTVEKTVVESESKTVEP